jgi:hypothetical protein
MIGDDDDDSGMMVAIERCFQGAAPTPELFSVPGCSLDPMNLKSP